LFRTLHSPLLIAALVLASCDGEPVEDGGMDAAADAAADAARTDAPPAVCEPLCAASESCCAVGTGTQCFDLRNDPEHCGECSVNCMVENRGDACRASSCTCGGNPLGCNGVQNDFCCPPRDAGGDAYCANLRTNANDCGACGVACDLDRADRCDGGECRCGSLRAMCDGTPESRCCQTGVDIGCVDTTADFFHCGGCANLCESGERCVNSACTTGPVCPGGCAAGEICCAGACCSRRSCRAGAGSCAPVRDGGVLDGGVPADAAAPADAGVPADGG